MEKQNDSRGRVWTGRILSGVVVAFLLFDASGKLARVEPVLKSAQELGFFEAAILHIGLILLICTILYAVPATSRIGAVLLTGYLGGAVVTHLRVDNPLFTHTVFPVYVGVLAWAGLALRDSRILRFFWSR
jgi:hypothetical protein